MILRLLSRKTSAILCTSLWTSRFPVAAWVGTSASVKQLRFYTTIRRTDSLQMSTSDSLNGKVMVPVTDAIALWGERDVKFVDGSWFLTGRNGRREFLENPRVAGARFFDIDDISNESSPYPHMMPTPNLFAIAMDAMGISNSDHLVIYGSEGCLFVHRAWFQIAKMGHGTAKTHLLDGSLADWNDQGGPMEDGTPSNTIINAKDLHLAQSTTYTATEPQNVVDKEEMLRLISQGDKADAVIVDVRAPERFRGEVEEPRPGMRLGHMPGAKNIFFKDLLKDDNPLQFKSTDELKDIIQRSDVDVDTDKKIVIHCGSGATACALVAALELCGRDSRGTFVYDASWSEWGASDDTPIEKDGKSVP